MQILVIERIDDGYSLYYGQAHIGKVKTDMPREEFTKLVTKYFDIGLYKREFKAAIECAKKIHRIVSK